MGANNLLEQLLRAGSSALGQVAPQNRGDIGKYAAGGLIGLLLGSRGGRAVGGKVLKYGSVAALGALAWKVYQEHQAKQTAAAPVPAPAAQPFAALPAPQAETHAQAMLKALIAGAKADGHIDERERGLIDAELQRLGAAETMRQWVDTELRRPVDPADVAAAATTPEMAAEVYLASVLAVDETTVMERAYLDELARQLRLAPELKAELERRAVQGA